MCTGKSPDEANFVETGLTRSPNFDLGTLIMIVWIAFSQPATALVRQFHCEHELAKALTDMLKFERDEGQSKCWQC